MVDEGKKCLREVGILDRETDQTLGNDQIAFLCIKIIRNALVREDFSIIETVLHRQGLMT